MSADQLGGSPETELKFSAEPAAIAALRRHADLEGDGRAQRVKSVYYDTPGHMLRKNGFSLRLRQAGRKRLQTVKRSRSGVPFTRDEWEVEVRGDDLDVAAIEQTPLSKLLLEADGQLTPVVVSDVRRTVRLHRNGAAVIEVALDEGKLEGGDQQEGIGEVELELKSGDPQALFDFARELSDEAPLRLCLEAKSDRGYRLAGDDGLAGIKAEHPSVPPEATAADAFRAVVRSCLRHIANAAALARQQSSEGIHQTRVGARRLRGALSVFRDLLDPQTSDHLKGELKWLVKELNDARDLDVYVGDTLGLLTDREADDPAMKAFRRRAMNARAKARKRAVEAVESSRFARLLLEIAAWAEVGELDAQRGAQPAPDFAAVMLRDLRKSVRKTPAPLSDLSPEERHELRIKVKKLRYTSEFFADSFGIVKQRRKFVTRLRKLQDVLGELNDVEVARDITRRLVHGKSSEMAFAAGVILGKRQAATGQLMDEAESAFAKFGETKPFWKVVWTSNGSRPTLGKEEETEAAH